MKIHLHPELVIYSFNYIFEEKRGDLGYGFNLPGHSYLINYFLGQLHTPKLKRNNKNDPKIARRTPVFPNLIKLFEQVSILPGHQP